MKKLLLISGTTPPMHCGVGIYTNLLLDALSGDKSLSIATLTAQTDEQLPGVTYIMQTSWRLRDVPTIIKAIKGEGPDIVHLQYPTVAYGRQLGINVLALFLRLFAKGAKVVVTIHELHELGTLARIRTLLTCLGAQQIIVSNAWDQSELPSGFKKRSEVIPIASNVQNTNKTTTADFKKLLSLFELDADAPTLCFFGKVTPNKGLELVVNALAMLPNYQLVIAGDKDETNSYHQSVLQAIVALGEPVRVAWPGYLPDGDISTLLTHCKYFVIAQTMPISTKSGTLLAAIEHRAIAIVHGEHSSPSHYRPLEERQNIVFYSPNSPEALAAAVKELDNNKSLREAIKQNLPSLHEYFSWESIANKHRELYSRILEL